VCEHNLRLPYDTPRSILSDTCSNNGSSKSPRISSPSSEGGFSERGPWGIYSGVIYIKGMRGTNFLSASFGNGVREIPMGIFLGSMPCIFLEREVYEGGREQLLQFSRIVNEHANKIEQNDTSTWANCLVKCLGSVIVIIDTLRDTLTHSLLLCIPSLSSLACPSERNIRTIYLLD
jgi:hypothetical protein